tara:strand:- start:422 stop:661 length:240 start_codon:yes stop_codon:yes gene_type:complete
MHLCKHNRGQTSSEISFVEGETLHGTRQAHKAEWRHGRRTLDPLLANAYSANVHQKAAHHGNGAPPCALQYRRHNMEGF